MIAEPKNPTLENPAPPTDPEKKTGPLKELRRLPEKVMDASYVRRTRAILERRRERVAKLRADTREDLRNVLKDIDRDVREGVGRIEGTARKKAETAWQDFVKTPVGKRLDGLFNRKAKSEAKPHGETKPDADS